MASRPTSRRDFSILGPVIAGLLGLILAALLLYGFLGNRATAADEVETAAMVRQMDQAQARADAARAKAEVERQGLL